MAFSPANFIRGTSIRFHCRLFLIPWFDFRVKSKSSISCCAQGRGYSNSFPVKYIPKKSLKSVENEATSLENGEREVNTLRVKDLGKRHNVGGLNVPRVDLPENSSSNSSGYESESHGASRFSNVNNGFNLDMKEKIDGDSEFEEKGFMEKPVETVEDDAKRFRGIQPTPGRQDVENRAIELLASRSFTALELKKKLQRKRCPADIVDAVIADFQSRGLIDDSLYAETYSQSRWSSSSWGPVRIRHGLYKKGVCEADADRAIKHIFENDEDCGIQEPGIAMSKLSMDQLYIKAAKQWQQSHGVPHDTRKSRIIRWLQYRGFNWSVIKHVLKKLESEGPR